MSHTDARYSFEEIAPSAYGAITQWLMSIHEQPLALKSSYKPSWAWGYGVKSTHEQ